MTSYPFRAELHGVEIGFAHSFGGPLLVVPRAHLASWWGCWDENGEHAFQKKPTDYDRACEDGDLPFVIPLRGADDPQRWAMVLEAPDGTCFWPLAEDRVLVVRWVGAESGGALVSIALAVPEDEWEATAVVLDVPAGGLSLFDSAMDGRRPEDMENGIEHVDLAPGRYAVDRIVEVDAVVTGCPSGDEDTMVQLLRLRRIEE